MPDSLDEIIAMLSNIREVTFKSPATGVVSEALGECAERQIDITLMDRPQRRAGRAGRQDRFHELSYLSQEP